MKKAEQNIEITPEDFDSFFLWKVFWKIIRQENPLVFFLKILLLSACFIALVLFIFLVGEFAD